MIINSFQEIKNKIDETRDQVFLMRKETGLALAARFMGLLNTIKEKANNDRLSLESKEQEEAVLANQTKKKFK